MLCSPLLCCARLGCAVLGIPFASLPFLPSVNSGLAALPAPLCTIAAPHPPPFREGDIIFPIWCSLLPLLLLPLLVVAVEVEVLPLFYEIGCERAEANCSGVVAGGWDATRGRDSSFGYAPRPSSPSPALLFFFGLSASSRNSSSPIPCCAPLTPRNFSFPRLRSSSLTSLPFLLIRRPRLLRLPCFCSAVVFLFLPLSSYHHSSVYHAFFFLLGHPKSDFDKDDGLSAYLNGTTEKRPRERFRSFVDSASNEDEETHDTEMDKNGKNSKDGKDFVYSRRGDEKRPDCRDYKEGDRRLGGRDDGRDRDRDRHYKRDDRRDGHRYEGKFIRKSDGRERRDSRDRRNEDRDGNWRPSKYSRDRDYDRDDSDGEQGKYGREEKKRTERSWKEIAERDRFLKDNRDRGRESFSSTPSEKKDRNDRETSSNPSDKREIDRSDRDKGQYSGDKVSKPGDTRFPTKLKLKVGGFSKVLQSDGSRSREESTPPGFELKPREKPSEKRSDKQPEPAKKRRHRLILQDNSDDDDYDPRAVVLKKHDSVSPSTPTEKSVEESDPTVDRANRSIASPSAAEASTPRVRKSSRIPKKKVLEDFADDIPEEANMDAAEEGQSPVEEAGGKSREEDDEDFSKGGDATDKDVSLSDDLSDDMDEEEDRPSKAKRRKSQDSIPYPGKSRNAPLTARQRTMQLGKDGDSELGPSLIEFPTGLSHTMGGRRGREKLTEEERQVKKAEAARRRKQLVEKTAKEIQANAIQKILGQDSSRKKKEERLRLQRQEIAQGKKSAALEPATNSIRWTMKPEGTIVSFSQDVDLPQLFSSAPPSYPPAREKCAAPTCTNAYKYRDSRSRMPLCSLACYKTIQPPALMAS